RHRGPSHGEMEERAGRQQRGRHPTRGDVVAAAGTLARAKLDQAEDEQHGSEEVGERDRDGHPAVFSGGVFSAGLAVGRPLNISSIRSVTTNPPTTLMVARTTATRPRAICSGSRAVAAIRMAPTRMMPWMALV